MDGEQLTAEDEKVVAGRLLAYRPNSNDKIGCLNGVDAKGQIVFNSNIETDSKRAHLFHEEINGPIEVPMAQYKLSNHPLPDPKMAASALLSQLLRLRLHHHHRLATGLLVPLRRSWSSTAEHIRMEEDDISVLIDTVSSLCEAAKYSSWEEQNYRQWKDEEAEIWRDIEPIAHLAKEILHSNRYKDGEQLTDEDEKAVAGRLLVYHPNCDDKVGCGLDSIARAFVPVELFVGFKSNASYCGQNWTHPSFSSLLIVIPILKRQGPDCVRTIGPKRILGTPNMSRTCLRFDRIKEEGSVGKENVNVDEVCTTPIGDDSKGLVCSQ
ncbi:hypothetical protein D5086_025441 [Populus alba]|uniref:Uncharacterized protein n=1 Tax=Populus alba TaxID=43335 RepID=A0ACC4AZZ7_POPAL